MGGRPPRLRGRHLDLAAGLDGAVRRVHLPARPQPGSPRRPRAPRPRAPRDRDRGPDGLRRHRRGRPRSAARTVLRGLVRPRRSPGDDRPVAHPAGCGRPHARRRRRAAGRGRLQARAQRLPARARAPRGNGARLPPRERAAPARRCATWPTSPPAPLGPSLLEADQPWYSEAVALPEHAGQESLEQQEQALARALEAQGVLGPRGGGPRRRGGRAQRVLRPDPEQGRVDLELGRAAGGQPVRALRGAAPAPDPGSPGGRRRYGALVAAELPFAEVRVRREDREEALLEVREGARAA